MRSPIIARSNSAKAPTICIIIRPAGGGRREALAINPQTAQRIRPYLDKAGPDYHVLIERQTKPDAPGRAAPRPRRVALPKGPCWIAEATPGERAAAGRQSRRLPGDRPATGILTGAEVATGRTGNLLFPPPLRLTKERNAARLPLDMQSGGSCSGLLPLFRLGLALLPERRPSNRPDGL